MQQNVIKINRNGFISSLKKRIIDMNTTKQVVKHQNEMYTIVN